MRKSQYRTNISYFLATVLIFYFFQLNSLGNVQEDYAQFPELKWLADKSVEVTQQNQSQATAKSYSLQLTGHFYPELDRTLLALRCLEWIWRGQRTDYEQMVQEQKNPRLSWESFQVLHMRLRSIAGSFQGLKSEQVYDAFKVDIVLGDIGKSKEVRKKLGVEFSKIEDHDLFLEKVFSCDFTLQQLPSYRVLSSSAQQILKDASELGHFGHIAHLEGGPEMFNGIVQSRVLQKNPAVFEFAYMCYMCDVAASMGHVNPQSALALNETTYSILELVRQTILQLANSTPQAVYNFYLEQRARRVGVANLKNVEDYLVGRFAAMMRLTDSEVGNALKAGYEELTDMDRELVKKVFYNSIFGESFLNKMETPTYMPAVLINLMNNPKLGDDLYSRIKEAFKLGSFFLAKALEEWCKDPAFDSSIVVNFNTVAGLVKQDPKVLINKKFQVDVQSGTVKEL